MTGGKRSEKQKKWWKKSNANAGGPAATPEELRRKYPPAPSRWNTLRDRMQADGTPDPLRREIFAEYAKYTGRSLIVYGSAFHVTGKAPLGNAQLLSLTLGDLSPFREVVVDLPGGGVDLLLHTPGGLAEAAEGMVALLRSKFNDVRVVVPLAAKSAGTMLAMSANTIIALPGAELGPIDPQFVIQGRFAPAKAIENQFDRAAKEIMATPQKIPAWVPILSGIGPSLLEECAKALELSKVLVSRWLEQYMFSGDADAAAKAATIAAYLSDYDVHMSHGRRIGVEELKAEGVKIEYAGAIDPKLDDLISRAWIGLELTLSATPAFKVFENSQGQAIFHQAEMEIRKVT
jgi:hypothetical protein